MRLAVLIIGLCLVMLVGMQSCTVMVGGGVTDDQDLSGGGAIGMLVSFLFILGSAFVMAYPKVSMIIFLVASFFGFIGASGSTFSDLYVWSFISLVLAVMSYFGIKKRRKKMSFKHQKTEIA